jgi:hypothetical protein
MKKLSKHIQIMRDTIVPSGEIKQKLKMIRVPFGYYPPFKVPQESVCCEAVLPPPMTFASWHHMGLIKVLASPSLPSSMGVSIELFQEQIESQLGYLYGMRPIVAEKLQMVKEAKIRGNPSAVTSRLQEVTKHKVSNISNPLIIFATPELVKFTGLVEALSALSHIGISKGL